MLEGTWNETSQEVVSMYFKKEMVEKGSKTKHHMMPYTLEQQYPKYLKR